MKIENIHSSWASKIYLDTPQEFFNHSADYWRNLIYERKILFFKQVQFTKEEYALFSSMFGKPWNKADYAYSHEMTEEVETKYGTQVISPFSNELIKKIPSTSMPWHADIPNRDHKPYPFRSLWITSNPNPETSGKTIWLNLEECFKYLTPEMQQLIPKVTVVQQSWYEPGKDIQEFPLLKIHPITGVKSLRLNYYNWGTNKTAWITDVKINGVSQGHCFLIRQWLMHLEKISELNYQHTWDLFDIALYDNWSFVHARSALTFDPEKHIRHFYRINIDHLTDSEWIDHKRKNIS